MEAYVVMLLGGSKIDFVANADAPDGQFPEVCSGRMGLSLNKFAELRNKNDGKMVFFLAKGYKWAKKYWTQQCKKFNIGPSELISGDSIWHLNAGDTLEEAVLGFYLLNNHPFLRSFKVLHIHVITSDYHVTRIKAIFQVASEALAYRNPHKIL